MTPDLTARLLPVWHNGAAVKSPWLHAGTSADEVALANLLRMDAAAAYRGSPATPAQTFVRAVMVSSLDGQTIGPDGSSRSISTPEDYWAFVTMRSLADVILVGSKTAVTEMLPLPRGRVALRPWRVAQGLAEFPAIAIVSTTGELPRTNLFSRAGACIVLTTASAESRVRARIMADHDIAPGVTPLVVPCAMTTSGQIDPTAVLAALGDLGHRNIVCEGGPRWLGAMFAAGAVDELALSTAHVITGGAIVPFAADTAPVRLIQRSLLLGDSSHVALYRTA